MMASPSTWKLASMLHWALQVPNAELKACWQLLIGYRNPQGGKHTLRCMTGILPVEHGMQKPVAVRWGKRERGRVRSTTAWRPTTPWPTAHLKGRSVQNASLPHYLSCIEQAIHKLSIVPCLKGISPPSEQMHSNPILKRKAMWKALYAGNYT